MKVVRVDVGQRPVITDVLDTSMCWEEIAGPGWVGCMEDGDEEFNFVATEIAEYLGWDESPNVLSGNVVFAGEGWTDVPDFVIRVALRYTGQPG